MRSPFLKRIIIILLLFLSSCLPNKEMPSDSATPIVLTTMIKNINPTLQATIIKEIVTNTKGLLKTPTIAPTTTQEFIGRKIELNKVIINNDDIAKEIEKGEIVFFFEKGIPEQLYSKIEGEYCKIGCISSYWIAGDRNIIMNLYITSGSPESEIQIDELRSGLENSNHDDIRTIEKFEYKDWFLNRKGWTGSRLVKREGNCFYYESYFTTYYAQIVIYLRYNYSMCGDGASGAERDLSVLTHLQLIKIQNY
jgi:hypothetical protein